MKLAPFISICIPAYGRAHILRRLLDSIVIQTYNDFNVVLTDNSRDTSVQALCDEYRDKLSLKYHRNEEFLEMGANWNSCMQKASGTWLKMMHDDDWFSDPASLATFAFQARQQANGFIFSGFYNVPDGREDGTLFIRKGIDLFFLKGSPYNLLRGNYIGAPSVTMIHKDTFRPYNPNLKWIVDTEGTMRMFQVGHPINYIAAPLVNVGIHTGQATTQYFGNPEVEVYEHCIMLHQHYPEFCRNFFAFDYCWRLVRNLKIKNKTTFQLLAKDAPVPPVFYSMIALQRAIPHSLLRKKVLSKGLMLLHYLYYNLSLFTKTKA